MDLAKKARKDFVDIIGVDPPGRTKIYFAANTEDFEQMQPGRRKLPSWVAGVAYGRYNTVLMRFSSSRGTPIDMERTLAHELSHIILRGAVGNMDLPRWFVEGLAQWQAKQFDLQRIRRLWTAMLTGRLIPLHEMTKSFPQEPSRVRLAYDQSFEFINYIIGEYGLDRFHSLIRLLGKKERFHLAVTEVYDESVYGIEKRWFSELKMSYGWIPLLSSGATVWSIATVLAILGYIRRRRDKSKRMRQWEEDERRQEEIRRAQYIAYRPEKRHDPDDETGGPSQLH